MSRKFAWGWIGILAIAWIVFTQMPGCAAPVRHGDWPSFCAQHPNNLSCTTRR